MTITGEKKGITYEFSNFRYEKKEVVSDWKVVIDGKVQQGKRAVLTKLDSKWGMRFRFDFRGKKPLGIGLEGKDLEKVLTFRKAEIESKKIWVETIADEIVQGHRPVYINIVGSDYPHYSPWLEDIPTDDVQDVLALAVEKIYGNLDSGWQFKGVCDYLSQFLPNIGRKEDLPDSTFDIEYSAPMQEYRGYNPDIVTGFKMTLHDIVAEDIATRKAAKAKKENAFNEAAAKAKETGEPQELGRWMDDCDDPSEECSFDTVIKYVLPNGETEIKRYHNW